MKSRLSGRSPVLLGLCAVGLLLMTAPLPAWAQGNSTIAQWVKDFILPQQRGSFVSDGVQGTPVIHTPTPTSSPTAPSTWTPTSSPTVANTWTPTSSPTVAGSRTPTSSPTLPILIEH